MDPLRWLSLPPEAPQLISAEVDRLTHIPFAPPGHTPHPKQRDFLSLTCLEALYGGAAGGGKSDALLMGALQSVDYPHYAALILRRTYADLALPDAIMARAKDWLISQSIHWNDKDKTFTFPSGATLTFGYLDTERDRFRYQSAAFQYIAFDELTQFPEQWYRYMPSRLRKLEGSPIPLRVRAASNPGGIGHDWVRRRFVDEETREARVFIPAILEDNPSVDAETYEKSLELLDAVTHMQLRRGVWVRDGSGLVYYTYSETKNDIEAPDIPKLDRYILALDFGYNDATAFTILGWQHHSPIVYIVESWKIEKLTPSEVGVIVRDTHAKYPFHKIVGDKGGMGKGYAEEIQRRFHIPIDMAEKANKLGFIRLFNGALKNGEIRVSKTLAKPLIDEWLELPKDDKDKEIDGFSNDCADAALYGWRAATAFLERPAEQPVREEAKIWEKQAAEIKAERLKQPIPRPWWKENRR